MILNNPKIKWVARNYFAKDLGSRKPTGVRHVLKLSNTNQICFYSSGSGPTIILSASLGRSVSDFNELIQELNLNNYRTIAIESRGIEIRNEVFGSDLTLLDLASDLERVLQQIGIQNDEKISLIGHAFGNRVVRCFASMFPLKVKSLILIAAGGRNTLPKDLEESLWGSMFSDDPIQEQSKHLRRAFFAKKSDIPNFWYYGWNRFLGKRQFEGSRAVEKSKWWNSGEKPLLLFQGLQDPIAPPEHSSEILKKNYNGSLKIVELPEASHALLPEAPTEIITGTINYLKTI